MASFTDFSKIPLFRYNLIMADPPWSFMNWSEAGEGKNAKAKYDCMDLDSIKEMRVGDLAQADCILWLWATNPLLREAFEVIDAWGFKFITAGHWVKTTSKGNICFGTGYVLRSAGEPFLIGKVGNPKTANNVRSVLMGERREHSRKPEEAYAAAEQLLDGPYLDLFSRESRDGWDNFGNEVEKFNE